MAGNLPFLSKEKVQSTKGRGSDGPVHGIGKNNKKTRVDRVSGRVRQHANTGKTSNREEETRTLLGERGRARPDSTAAHLLVRKYFHASQRRSCPLTSSLPGGVAHPVKEAFLARTVPAEWRSLNLPQPSPVRPDGCSCFLTMICCARDTRTRHGRHRRPSVPRPPARPLTHPPPS